MIVVTGPGRGGTSFIASLYRELGFDPGGEWFDDANSGYEDNDIVRANGAIIRELRVSVLASRAAGDKIRREHARELGDTPPPRLRTAIGNALRVAALRILDRPTQELDLIPWDRVDAVVDRHAARLLELGASHPVVKDPRFCWTLGIWAAAGVSVEHVLLCVRNLDAMVASRVRARQVAFKSIGVAKNSFVYGMGLCLASLHDYRIPYDIVQFPDFLERPDTLYEHMRFPRPVDRQEFLAAVARLRREDLVHDRR
ncbi:MAG: hypothetical protein HY873_07945 [Chloroflexi bacterium]|nr:hypothetical protein [Chloroflexota bacterium]